MQANPKNSKKNKKQQQQQPLIDHRLSESSQSVWTKLELDFGEESRRRVKVIIRTRWMNKETTTVCRGQSACKQVWCMRFWFLLHSSSDDGGGMAHGLLGQPALVRGANLLISQRWLMGRRIRVLLFFTTCLLACLAVCACALLLLPCSWMDCSIKIK